MSCKSSLCVRCAKGYVDNWVSQVSQMLHAGVIYRHIILTVPAMFRTTFYHNWLRVLGTAERSQIDQRIRQQLHAIVPLLYAFKSEQQPLELIFPRKGPLNTQA